MNKFTTFIALIILFLSCSESDNIKKIDIPAAVQLESTINKSNVDLLMASRIFTYKDKLIIFEPMRENMFKVFDLNTLSYLYSYGNRGQSGNEFVSGIGLNDIIVSDYVEIQDGGVIRYIEFCDSTANIVKSNPLPLAHLKNPINRLSKISDTIYYFDNFSEEDDKNEYIKLDLSTTETSTFSPYPKWISVEKSDAEVFINYVKSSTYNKSQNKIAAFYFNFPVMKVIDGTSCDVISETHLNMSDFSFSSEDKEKIIFTNPVSTDNYIYVMWVNSTKADVGVVGGNFKPGIMVFDWTGNLLANYKLAHAAVSFTVSEDYCKIYTPSFGDENAIYTYELPYIKPSEDFTYFENSIYSIELFPTYNLAQTSKEDGADKITERWGYKVNGNYFTQIRDDQNKKIFELETMQITVCEPMEIDLLLPSLNSGEILMEKTISINDASISNKMYKSDFTDPKGEKGSLYTNEYGFYKEGKYVNISISSSIDNLAQYDNYMRHMIKTIELK